MRFDNVVRSFARVGTWSIEELLDPWRTVVRGCREFVTCRQLRGRHHSVFVVLACLLTSVAAPAVAAHATVVQHSKSATAARHHKKTTTSAKFCAAASSSAPSANAVAFALEASTKTVQEINQVSGSAIGAPISVGTGASALAYYKPPAGVSGDPEVLVANTTANSVKVIDATTLAVLSTIALPTGAAPSAIAASTTSPLAAVVDAGTGAVSILNLTSATVAATISLGATKPLSAVAFSSSGTYLYVSDPLAHSIYVLTHSSNAAPFFTAAGSYLGSASFAPTALATDASDPSSSTVMVANDATGSYSLVQFSVTSPTSWTTVATTALAGAPGRVVFSSVAGYTYVALTNSSVVDAVAVGSSTLSIINAPSNVTNIAALALSGTGTTLLLSDTTSATVAGLTVPSGTLATTSTLSAPVSALVAAPASVQSWNAYVVVGGGANVIDVVNSQANAVVQTIADSRTPEAVVASPDGSSIYVAEQSSVSIISTALVGGASSPFVATIALPSSFDASANLSSIAVSPNGDSVLVTDVSNGSVDVLDTNPVDASYRTFVSQISVLGGLPAAATPQGAPAFSPDGAFAYVPIAGTTSTGITVLSRASSTSTGYRFDTAQLSLTQQGSALYAPSNIVITPDDEQAYVVSENGDGVTSYLYNFPIMSGAQAGLLASTAATSPTPIGLLALGLAFSPEDSAAIVSYANHVKSIEVGANANTTVWNAVGASPYMGNLAVSPDGTVVAALAANACNQGANALQFFNASTGSTPSAYVPLPGTPLAVAFAPQSTPQAVALTELAGGAANPGEAAISGLNDVVAAAPSNAPGASASVDTATGAYAFSLSSLTLSDRSLPLTQAVSYDSSRATAPGMIATGWLGSYEIGATQVPPSSSPGACAVTITFANGATTRFSSPALTNYSSCPLTGYQSVSYAQENLSIESNCNAGDACFVLTLASGTTYLIDAALDELLQVTDTHGDTTQILWGPAIPACSNVGVNQICEVLGTDTQRALTYSYPAPATATCPVSAISCVVVSDPVGRSVTYVDNASHQLSSVVLALGTQSATYGFSYNASGQVVSWCDPANQSGSGSCVSGAATTITYLAARVSALSTPTTALTSSSLPAPAPTLANSVTPVTTFDYSGLDPVTGTGTVLVANPDFNQLASASGASETLDTYADFELISSVQGYGPLGLYGLTTTPASPASSQDAVPLRDPLTMMPDEEMNALAGSQVGLAGATQYDSGITLNSYDPQGNLLSSTTPATTAFTSGETSTSTFNAAGLPLTSTTPNGNLAGANAAAQTTTNTYDAHGNLLTSVSPAVNAGGPSVEVSNYYNASGLLCASRDAVETALYGVLASCSPTGPHATLYAYDALGDQISVSDPLGNVTQFAYNADGQLCATLTPNAYAAGARLSACPTAPMNGATVNLAPTLYGQFAQRSRSLDGSGSFATTTTCYDANGDVLATIGPLNTAPSCSSLSPTTSVDTTFSAYDPGGDLVEQIGVSPAPGQQGATTITGYDAVQNPVITLNSAGYALWSTNPSAALAGYETGDLINSAGETIASGPVHNLTMSCATTTTGCAGATTSIYDAGGNLTTTNTPDQVVTHSGANPDAAAQGSSTTQSVSGVATTIALTSNYDANQQVTGTSSTTPGVAATSSAYTPAGLVCWRATTMVSSPNCLTIPTSATAVNYYNPDGQLLAQVGAGGASMTCNPLAAYGTYTPGVINTSALCAFTIYYVYDEDGRLVKEIQPSAVASPSAYEPAGLTTSYGYDADSNEVTIVNPSQTVTTQRFNAANELIAQSYSDSSNVTSYSYNADGTRATMTDASGTTTYSYNGLGQLVSTTDGNGASVTYAYNSAGQVSCVSYPSPGVGTWANCSSAGASTNAPPPGDVTYNYDQVGELSSVVDWNGDTFLFGYTCAGQLAFQDVLPTASAPGLTSVTPCAVSGTTPTAPTLSGGTDIMTTNTYASASAGEQLASAQTSAIAGTTTPLIGFGSASSPLTYDANGNVTSETPVLGTQAQATDTFSYNSRQELTQGPEATTSATTYSYNAAPAGSFKPGATYDNMALATQSQSSPTRVYNYAANGQVCWEETNPFATTSQSCAAPSGAGPYRTYSYNASGERTGTTAVGFGATTALTWNQDTGTLSCYNTGASTCTTPSAANPSTFTYTYNADGLRMSASAWNGALTTTDFTWNSKTSALLSNGTDDFLYGLNPNVPLAQIDPVRHITDLLVSDPSQNVRGIIELSAAAAHPDTLVNYVDYTVLGKPITANGGAVVLNGLLTPNGSDPTSTTPFGFGGGYLDPTALIYLVHRYYDQATGQFISVDPALNSTGQTYVYAGDNSVNKTDYLGQNTLGFCGNIGAAIPAGFFIGGLDVCLTRTLDRSGEDDIGIVANPEFVAGSFVSTLPNPSWVSGGVGLQVSNSTNLSGLAQVSWSVSFFSGLVVTTVFSNLKHGSSLVYGVEVGLADSSAVGVGFGSSYGVIHHFTDPWVADPARYVWDEFNSTVPIPFGGVQGLLAKARANLSRIKR